MLIFRWFLLRVSSFVFCFRVTSFVLLDFWSGLFLYFVGVFAFRCLTWSLPCCRILFFFLLLIVLWLVLCSARFFVFLFACYFFPRIDLCMYFVFWRVSWFRVDFAFVCVSWFFYSCITLVSCFCLLYTSPSPRDMRRSRMPSSA